MLKTKLKSFFVPRKKLIILNYHQVSKEFNKKLHNKYIWNSVTFFEEQIQFLQNNFTIVSLKNGFKALKENAIKETLIAITFDDGDTSMTQYVMPLLEKLNVPATFFINTAYYDKGKTGYWYNLGPYHNDLALLDAAQTIRKTASPQEYLELIQLEDKFQNNTEKSPFYTNLKDFENCTHSLFHFGLHGHEHLRFSMLTEQQQFHNLKKNIDTMQSWSNYVPFFAIPFGKPQDWNSETLKIANQLNVIPLLAHQGYNVRDELPLLRFSVDGVPLNNLINNLSPFINKYLIQNGLKK